MKWPNARSERISGKQKAYTTSVSCRRAFNTGIEVFVSGQRCLDTYESNYSYYCDKADSRVIEMNRLIELVADEWDDGIAHFGLKPSEILP
jgi:hypothetical protein